MLTDLIMGAWDRSLRDIMGLDVPFGGKRVVLAGDFRQILPVVPRGNRAQIVNASLKHSPLWPCFRQFRFSMNVRISRLLHTNLADATSPEERAEWVAFNTQALEYAAWLLTVGNGVAPTTEPRGNRIVLPPELRVQKTQDLIDWVYPDLATNASNTEWLAQRAILSPKNSDVDAVNDRICTTFPGVAIILMSADQIEDSGDGDVGGQVPVEYLNTLNVSGMPSHALRLKGGMPLMLLRNLNPAEGLCNGTRLAYVKMLGDQVMMCTVASPGEFFGRTILIPRIRLCPSSILTGFRSNGVGSNSLSRYHLP